MEQPVEVFCKKNCSYRKETELESLLNKVVPTQFSCEYYKTFNNTYFEEHLRMAASECHLQEQWEQHLLVNLDGMG